MSKQHCWMLQVEQFFRQNRMLLPHCCFFGNNVAGFGNSVERNFILSTKSKQIEHFQFVSTLSKGRNFVRHCCQKRQQCRSNIRLCRKNCSTCSNGQCCFDMVGGVDGTLHRVSKKSTHIIGYKLRNSCLILIIFGNKIPHIIWHRITA